MPVWELASNETDCMIGYHSVSVMADAMAKGIKGFDYEKCFEAAKHSAMLDHLGLDAYKKNGFISIDDEHESVSKTVEYAYDDWCIAQMAMILNKKEDYNYFMTRSQNWKNLFDWETGFIRPKKNGGWDKPFDPREVNNNYTEGNGWQYTFFVPQSIGELIEYYGGDEIFEAKLDEMFNSGSKTTGRQQVDVTGLIGQYAHGNEPSHHMAYMYNYVGRPEKTKEKVHYILNNFYKNTPDGLIGNEDCGQMSAWYVLSSMGIYPHCPGTLGWNTTEPLFDFVRVHFDERNSGEIEQFGKNDNSYLFGFMEMLNKPTSQSWEPILPVPIIEAKSKSFKDKLEVSIKYNTLKSLDYQDNLKAYYRIIKVDINEPFIEYVKPIVISETTKIEAYVKPDFMSPSKTISAQFFKKPNNYTIQYNSKYDPQYHAGGDEGLIDGIYGTTNWRKGEWQGYQSQDFEAVVDLKEVKSVQQFSANYLQDSRSWILMPTKVEYYSSSDNVNFTFIGSVENDLNPNENETKIKNFEFQLKNSIKARYIKVKATNFGKLPEWHQGFGGDAYIFVDEIVVK